MGVLNALGVNGPFTKWLDGNRGRLTGLGYGLASGQNFGEGVAAGIKGAYTGRQQDDIWAKDEKEQAQLQAAIDGIAKYRPELADLVRSGAMDPNTAWNETLKGWNQQPASPMEINGQLVDPSTGKVIGDYRTPDASQQPDPFTLGPGQVRYGPDGQVLAEGPPPTPRPITEAQQRMGMINNIVQDEAKVLLGDPASGTPGVYSALGEFNNQVLDANGAGRALTSADYQRAASAVETISQHYLYALSGQAAPDGEVKRVARTLMPVIGENPASVLEKKRRLESYLQTIQDFVAQTGGAQPGAATGDMQLVFNPQTGELEPAQ